MLPKLVVHLHVRTTRLTSALLSPWGHAMSKTQISAREAPLQRNREPGTADPFTDRLRLRIRRYRPRPAIPVKVIDVR